MSNPIQGIVNSIGKVIRALFIACPIPAQLWFETAVVAAGHVFTSNVSPVWKQDVKLLTGKTWLKHATQRLEQLESEASGFTDGLTRHMHFIGEVADKSVFWLWIASMVSEFIYDWGTLMLQVGGCDAKKKHCVTTYSHPFGSASVPHTWVAGPAWREDFPTPGLIHSSTFTIFAGETYAIGFAITFNLIDGGPCAGSARIIEVQSGQVVYEHSASEDDSLKSKGPTTFMVQGGAQELDHQYQIQVRADQDHIGVGMGFASGQLTLAHGDCVQFL